MTVADNLAMTRLVANLSMSIDPTSDLGFHGLNQKPLGTFPENPAQHILTFTEWKDSCLNVTIVHGGVLLCLVGTRGSSYLHPEYAAFFIQPSTTFGYIPITDDKGRSNLNAEIVGGPLPCRNHVALSCHDG